MTHFQFSVNSHLLLQNSFAWPPTDPFSGECPVTSFECPGGRCLPLSWRCNGQVECLGEGDGADEEGCAAEEETSPGMPRDSEAAETNDAGDSENPSPAVQSRKDDRTDELLALLKERQETEQPRESAAMPAPIRWPCGGLLRTFYGTFCPPSPQGPPLLCVWTVDPDDSRPLRLDLQQLVLGPGDTLTVHNRAQGKGDVIKIVSARHGPSHL